MGDLDEFEGVDESKALEVAIGEVASLAERLHFHLIDVLNKVTDPNKSEEVIISINSEFQAIYDRFSGDAQDNLAYVFETLNIESARIRTELLT